MNKHNCIKCNAEYSDEEIDAYYCPSCEVEKKRIAAEIDAKMANRPKVEPTPRFSRKDFEGKNGHIFFNSKYIL